MNSRLTNIVQLALLMLVMSCGPSIPEHIEKALADLPENVDYNFHIKPILSDRCYACHGPDANKREADLRLDTKAGAYAALASGKGKAIVAGNVSHSKVITRILSDDPTEKMPPPDSKLKLSDREKALIIKWIDEGATYENHWAFITPIKHEVPAAGQDWAKNEIDNFIYAKLEELDIEPSPEASKEKMIRRVFFDITGLAPTLDDLDKWISDPREDYYDHLVDYLLEQKSFGERMAAHWLDVSRFADSEGYLDDFHHSFWPYRDWVIKAYNDNLSFDKFLLWQLAGDQLPDPTSDQILATTFNRNHKQNSEGGIIPEEFRVEYVSDRTNTVGTAFMGLTLGCAKCHDHKYDPISQKNYFELFSFFNSTIERGDGIFGYNAIENGQYIPHELSMNSGPVLALPSEEVAAIKAFIDTRVETVTDSLEQVKMKRSDAFKTWIAGDIQTDFLSEVIHKNTITKIPFNDMEVGKTSDLAKGTSPAIYYGKISSVKGKLGKGLMSDAAGQFVADGERALFERSDPFTISFWVSTPKAFEEAHIIYNGNNRIQGYRGWDVVQDGAKLHFRLNHAHPYQSIDISTSKDLQFDEWYHFVWTYDGSSQASGMRLYQNGELLNTETHRDYLLRSTKPYTDKRATVYAHYNGLIIGNRHYDQDFTGGKLDELQILNVEADEYVAKYLYDKEIANKQFDIAIADNSPSLQNFFNLYVDKDISLARNKLQELRRKQVETIDTVQEIMVMGDYENERQTYILERGVYDAHGDPVERKVPEEIYPWKDDLPKNRLGLAQWMLDPNHPLTARVAVNQLWYLLFGKGIVETVEDFGNQGALPSHPELLDWLALDFIESNWDIKRMIKKMVSSATYRQTSKHRPELNDLDPNNKLLASSPRYRMSAEMIRDNILSTSGLLNEKLGGPSAFPYQPDGLWKEVMTHPFFPEYEVDYKDGLYRRSIYTFWKRNMPPPSMLVFDASSRAECQVRRQISNTPLQALVLLNDPQKIEGCRVLAEKMWKMSEGNIKDATNQAFRLLTSRVPNPREHQLLLEQYDKELSYFEEDSKNAFAYLNVGHLRNNEELPINAIAALARINNTIMNTTEAYYKN